MEQQMKDNPFSLWLKANGKKFQYVGGEEYVKADDILEFIEWVRENSLISTIDDHKRFKAMREAVLTVKEHFKGSF